MASTTQAFGIDLGTIRSVIATFTKNGVEIITNELNNKQTPNFISFTSNERLIGQLGLDQLKTNYKNTVQQFNRFLAINASQLQQMTYERGFITNEIDYDEKGKPFFRVQYKGATMLFSPEQLIAAILTKTLQIVSLSNACLQKSSFVISVPSFYSEFERKAILDACKIANFPLTRLLNEQVAVCTNYGMTMKFQLTQVPRIVVFIDIGHSKTSAYIGAFTREGGQILAQIHDRFLGARDLDYFVTDQLSKKFQAQHGVNPLKNPKCVLKLNEAIEKARRELTIKNETTIHIEFLIYEIDFNLVLTLEEFEQMCAPVLNRFEQVFVNLEKKINFLKIKDQIHSVELIGGGTQMPSIQKLITKTLEIKEVNSTLNHLESVAKGCAIISAAINSQFNCEEYKVEDLNFYNVKIGWKPNSLSAMQKSVFFNSGYQVQENIMVLFEQNQKANQQKSISLKTSDPIDLTLFYEPKINDIDNVIAHVKIPKTYPTGMNFETVVLFNLNHNGIIQVEEVLQKEMINSYAYQKKTATSQIKYFISSYHHLMSSVLEQHTEHEQYMKKQDEKVRLIATKRSELEQYIITIKKKIDGEFQPFLNQNTYQQVLKVLQTTDIFLRDRSQLDIKKFEDKIYEIKLITQPVQTRQERYNQYLQQISEMTEDIKLIHKNEISEYNSTFIDRIIDIQQLLKQKEQWIQEIDKTKDIEEDLHDLQEQFITLRRDVEKVQQIEKTEEWPDMKYEWDY